MTGNAQRRHEVYDVLYLDHSNREKVLARSVARDAACDLARAEARKRRVGRMFLAGSVHSTDLVLIVEARQQAA
jgi:hypothetical protein